jgi:hypothetical protein
MGDAFAKYNGRAPRQPSKAPHSDVELSVELL